MGQEANVARRGGCVEYRNHHAGCFQRLSGIYVHWKVSKHAFILVGYPIRRGKLKPCLSRFIAGLGCGAASMVNPLYISENAPRAIRGLLTGIYQVFIVTGIMIAFWINYGALLHFKGEAQWVVSLAMQALPATLLFVGMLLCNESPRFLAKQDKWERSKIVLSKVRGLPESHPYVEEEFNEICTQLERERGLAGGSGFMALQREMWTIPGNRKRVILSIVLMICQQMTGVNAINYYAPTIFENLGINGTSTNLFATGVYGIVKLVACLIFIIFAADSLGRRRALLITAVIQALSMLYVGLYIRIKPPVEGEPVPPAGYVALVCIFIFVSAFEFGWGPCCWIYVAEIPSARLRSGNVAFAAATQWLFNFVVARAVPEMLVTVGRHGYGFVYSRFIKLPSRLGSLLIQSYLLSTYIIFAVFCFCMFFITWFFIPETKGTYSISPPSRPSVLVTYPQCRILLLTIVTCFIQVSPSKRWTIFSELPNFGRNKSM